MPGPRPTALSGSADQRCWLEGLFRRYHRPRYIAPDPLQIVRRCDRAEDREVVGLLAAALAYGNVKAILGGIDQALARIGPRPAAWLSQTRPSAIRHAFDDYRYRVTAGPTLAGLFIGARQVITHHGSLGAALASDFNATGALPAALDRWVERIERAAGLPLDHLLARPARGSACKRLMLYLRWMVRRDAIDPGGWPLDPALLIAPVDTHMHRIALHLGWTRRKQANLATALDITAALRRHDPADPLRYDFALTRPGIRNELLEFPEGG